MGRAAKLKAARKAYRQDLDFQKAVTKERKRVVNKGMNIAVHQLVGDNVYIILYVLAREFEWGKVRLWRFMDSYKKAVYEYCDYLEDSVDDMPSFAEKIVKAKGFDLAEWEAINGKLTR